MTGPFTVAAKPPIIFVTTPENDSVLSPDLPILFIATGYDAEDGPMEGDVFAWTSDRDGDLGRGEKLWVNSLSPGWHLITVSAEDSDDHAASDAIRIFVGQRIYLPMLVR